MLDRLVGHLIRTYFRTKKNVSYLMSPLRVHDHVRVVLVLKPAAVARVGLVVLGHVVELIRRIILHRITDETGSRRSRRRRRRCDDSVGEADLFLLGQGVVVMRLEVVVNVVDEVGGAAGAAGFGGDHSVDLVVAVVVVVCVVMRVLPVTWKMGNKLFIK